MSRTSHRSTAELSLAFLRSRVTPLISFFAADLCFRHPAPPTLAIPQRNAVGGSLISAVVGVSTRYFFYLSNTTDEGGLLWLASAVAVSVAIFFMVRCPQVGGSSLYFRDVESCI